MAIFSKTQIDRLGDRLRKSPLDESDLKMLDEYRRSFGEVYEKVVKTIREELTLEPTGRPAKSTSSIVEKLLREHIRLSQMQDIAGCRVIVADINQQDYIVAQLNNIFPLTVLVDRRIHPSYGYRAVHVVVKSFDKLIEIQVRTELQHQWAELSEKFSDTINPLIKYGGGNKEIQGLLRDLSNLIENFEKTEKGMLLVEKDNEPLSRMKDIKTDIKNFINKHSKLFRELEN